MKKERLYKLAAIALAVSVWQVASMLVGMEMLLASPVTVVKRLCTCILEEEFIGTVLYSMLRITGGFLLALLLGCLLAVMAGRFRIVEIMLWPYVTAMKAVPVASFIILCLIWFSYTQLTVFIAFLIAFPVIYSNFLQGMKTTDPKMLEMAEVFGIGWGKKLLYIYLPNVKSYIVSACSIAVGMAWKAGVAAEVIGVVANSIGEKLYEAKVYFLNADLLAWTIVIILLSIIEEKLVHLLLAALFKGLERL